MLIILTVIFLLCVLIGCSYVFLVMPRVNDRADMDMLSTDYAKNGLSTGGGIRGSLSDIEAAKAYGYGIWLGVSYRGGDAVVSSSGVPFSEVLERIDGAVPLMIELGEDKYTYTLCRRLCELLDIYAGAFAIVSLSPKTLAFFKRYRPSFARGFICAKSRTPEGKKFSRLYSFLLFHMMTNVRCRPDFVCASGARIRLPVFRILVTVFRCRGFVVGINRQKQYKKAHSLGLFTVFENLLPQ